MSWDSRVVWSEGMFLRTQHFQQHDRYLERLVGRRVGGLVAHGWGVEALQIERDLLAIGKFALGSGHGVMRDGTPFVLPEDAPPPLDVPETARDATIYLTLPVRRPGAAEILTEDRSEAIARYVARDIEVVDTVAGFNARANIQIASLRLRYAIDGDELSGYVLLPLARVVEVRPDRSVVLDEAFIAPCLNCAAQAPLAGFIADIAGRLFQRAEALAARVAGPGARGFAEIAEFLVLQLVNRNLPLLSHLAADAGSQHPELLFRTFIELAGELATFTTDSRRAAEFPPYRHDDLRATFQPVLADLRESLSKILAPTAIPITLQKRKFGVQVAIIEDTGLFKSATFVTAVRAPMAIDALARQFPTQVKFAPVEQITQIVNSALPGIPLRALQVVPRQLPYVGNTLYFELDRNNSFWKQMERPGGTGGLALHVGAALGEIELELWAIKA
jgi:type VI secretion system protein ImpJ